MPKPTKKAVEISLVSAELTGLSAAPVDALATIVGESEAPKAIAQGVIDFTVLPEEGEEVQVTIPLTRPTLGTACGKVTLAIKG